MAGMKQTATSCPWRNALILIVPVLIAGCLTQQPEAAPPVSESQFITIRQQYMASDPMARVGLVIDVLPDAHLASVGSVPTKDFHEGDVITFIDSNQATLTMGHVETIDPKFLVVRYDPPGPKGRIPAVGDMAVRAIY